MWRFGSLLKRCNWRCNLSWGLKWPNYWSLSSMLKDFQSIKIWMIPRWPFLYFRCWNYNHQKYKNSHIFNENAVITRYWHLSDISFSCLYYVPGSALKLRHSYTSPGPITFRGIKTTLTKYLNWIYTFFCQILPWFRHKSLSAVPIMGMTYLKNIKEGTVKCCK